MLSMLLFNKVAPCKGVRIPESGKFFLWNPDCLRLSKTVLDSFTCGERFHVRTAMWLTLFIYLFIHLFNLLKFNKQLFSNTVTFLTKVGLFLPSTRSYVLSISLFERSSPKGTSTFPRTLRNEGGKCCVL